MHNCKPLIIGLLIALSFQYFSADAQRSSKPQLWLTDPDHGILFKQQDQDLKQVNTLKSVPTIIIDKSKIYQQMDGFGFALTGGSAALINKMSADKQAALLKDLFGVDKNDIG